MMYKNIVLKGFLILFFFVSEFQKLVKQNFDSSEQTKTLIYERKNSKRKTRENINSTNRWCEYSKKISQLLETCWVNLKVKMCTINTNFQKGIAFTGKVLG